MSENYKNLTDTYSYYGKFNDIIDEDEGVKADTFRIPNNNSCLPAVINKEEPKIRVPRRDFEEVRGIRIYTDN